MSAHTNMIRILAVDGSQPDMKVVAEAASGREAIQQFRTHLPDISLGSTIFSKIANLLSNALF
jgi:DNA-binding NarL/FixJ family response regulator